MILWTALQASIETIRARVPARGASGLAPRYASAVLIGIAAMGCAGILRSPSAEAEARPPRSQSPAPVILISLDGFRPDYLDRFPAPALRRLAREGVRAAMRPAFPSLTFPNHHTIVTGLHPEQHRITGNEIVDPTGGGPSLTMNSQTPPWWTWVGEPIWVTAERNGLKTATMFWPASNALINGYRPTYRHAFDTSFPYERRVSQVLDWLELPAPDRPQFITLYFEETDRVGHESGPFSEPIRRAVTLVDTMVDRLMRGLDERRLRRGVNVIVTSDHGMSAISADRIVYLSDALDIQAVATRGAGPCMFLSPRDGDVPALLGRLRRVPHVRAYTWDQVPEHLHFRQPPERADFAILLLADDGWRVFRARPEEPPKPSRAPLLGAHGYDSAYDSMKALFIGHGPSFARGRRLHEFDSARVHPLVLTLLGLRGARPADLDVFADGLASALLPVGQR